MRYQSLVLITGFNCLQFLKINFEVIDQLRYMTRHKSETDRAVFIQARFFLTVERIVATQDLIGHTYI